MDTAVLLVKAPSDDFQERVAEAVVAYYHSFDEGEVYSWEWAEMKPFLWRWDPLTEVGCAISPVEDGWVSVSDSQGFTANAALGRFLAEALEVPVVYAGNNDSAQLQAHEVFGPFTLSPADDEAARSRPQLTWRDMDTEERQASHVTVIFDTCPEAYDSGGELWAEWDD